MSRARFYFGFLYLPAIVIGYAMFAAMAGILGLPFMLLGMEAIAGFVWAVTGMAAIWFSSVYLASALYDEWKEIE